MTGFKKGDRVEVIDAGGDPKTTLGDKGTVLRDSAGPGNGALVAVDFDMGYVTTLCNKRLKLLDFVRGDTVVVTDDCDEPPPGLHLGAVGKVYHVQAHRVCVEFDGWDGGHNGNVGTLNLTIKSRWWFTRTFLRHAPAAPPAPTTTMFPFRSPMFSIDVRAATPARGDKFKNGDSIVCVRPTPPFTVGDKATVVRCDGDGIPWIRRDGAARMMSVDQRYFELAPTEKPQTFIVVSDEGPSSKPFKHTSRGSAEVEADRLAKVKPGMTFTVYQAVTAIKVPAPVADIVFLDKAA